MGGRLDTQLALGPRTPNKATARRRSDRQEPVWLSRRDEIGLDGHAEKRAALSDQVAALQECNRELADQINRLHVERSQLRSQVASLRNLRMARPAPAHTRLRDVDERRRLERDLHDGVQNELVSLIVELALAQENPDTPPALADMLAGLEARVQAVLDSVRSIARGIYPALLVDFGVEQALRAQAARGATPVRVVGTAPRSAEVAEEAVYFACSEAIQNVAKHAGRAAQVTLGLHHDHGSLAVRVADDGRGFDPTHSPEGAGLQNIRDRIESLGGTVNVTSNPARDTVVTIWLRWPRPTDPRR